MYVTRNPVNKTDQARRRTNALHNARQTLDLIRARPDQVRPHRALRRMHRRPATLVQALLLPLVICLLLHWATPLVMHAWKVCIDFWLAQLDLPLRSELKTGAGDGLRFYLTTSDLGSNMPGSTLKAGTAAGLALLFASTFLYRDANLPWRYLVRILCVVQALALLFFWVAPSQFPYTVPDHVGDMVRMGFMLLLVIPILLAIGYYLLPVSFGARVVNTAFILGYFLMMIPHKVVLHALLLHYCSLLYMPLLYICFGSVLDILLFIGLYSWVVSRLPPDAAPIAEAGVQG